MTATERNDKSSAQPIPYPEWFVAAVGLVLVVANFGYLGRRAVQEKTPPSFVAEIDLVERTREGFLVWVNVQNNGGVAVANLHFTTTFRTDDSSEVIIDYLPAQSVRRAGFLTDGPVTPAEVTFHFTSFTEP